MKRCDCKNFYDEHDKSDFGLIDGKKVCSDCAKMAADKPRFESLKVRFGRKSPERQGWSDARWAAFFCKEAEL